jgi:hypothetical protein
MARPAKAKSIRIVVGDDPPTLEIRHLAERKVSLTIGYEGFDIVLILPDHGPAAEWLSRVIQAGVLTIPFTRGDDA